MSPATRYLRLLAWRPAMVLVAGVLLAVVAEGSSIGLLGLSGWFIASCYLSGLNPLSRFSYLAPSGGVRSLAMSRIAGRYVERLVTHAGTLRWLTRLRVRMFLDAAAAGPDRMRRLSTGEALDRAMSDADTLDRVLIRTVLPVGVAGIGVLAGAGVIGGISVAAAAVFLSGALITATVAVFAGRRPTVAAARGAARAELIASVDAWAEMVSLGAVKQLRAAAADRFGALRKAESVVARSRVRLVVDCCVGATTALVLAVCLFSSRPISLLPARPISLLSAPPISLPDVTLIVLLTVGVLELVAALPAARRSAEDASRAADRLAVLAPRSQPGTGRSPARKSPDVLVIGVPLAPRAAARVPRVDLRLDAGGLLVVSGRSGSGKTTLLRAVAGELDPAAGVVLIAGRPPRTYPAGEIVFVAHDDYLFTGSVMDNLRLADPEIATARVETLLAAMSLTQRGISADTPLGAGGRQLSGGERRRLCLARAIARVPRVLLLDEPTEGVDEPTAQLVLRQLRNLLPATTIIAAIHDKDLGVLTDHAVVRLSLDDPAPMLVRLTRSADL
jgi:ATP-binding cassette subfamily C protein CydC